MANLLGCKPIRWLKVRWVNVCIAKKQQDAVVANSPHSVEPR